MSSNMKNSNRNKETTKSENFEKSLQNWKLPPSSASDFFKRSRSCSFLPDCRIKTVEKEIPLDKGYATFPLFSNLRQRAHQLCYGYVHVGMIRVGLKPTKLGSNSSAIICLRDKRLRKFEQSIVGMVESSLCDGPIYFSYFPGHCVALSDARASFCIDVKIKGDEKIILMYKFHYEVMNFPSLFDMSRYGVDKRGETTLFLTDIAQSNRLVSRKISWDQIAAGKGSEAEINLPASSSSGGEMGAVGSANIDWKETAKAHVLKVDVPGFKKEEIKVEIEDDRIIQISGERSNEQEEEGEEEEEEGKWHRVERRSFDRFLRRLRLPENAKLDEVKAAVKNGVLTVTVAKEEVDRKAQVRAVHISG